MMHCVKELEALRERALVTLKYLELWIVTRMIAAGNELGQRGITNGTTNVCVNFYFGKRFNEFLVDGL